MRRWNFARVFSRCALFVRKREIDPDTDYQFLPTIKKINLDQ